MTQCPMLPALFRCVHLLQGTTGNRVPCCSTNVRCCLQQVVNGNSTAAQPRRAVQEADRVDYSSWPVKELRRFLTERGVDPSSIVEKNDLVSQARPRIKLICGI